MQVKEMIVGELATCCYMLYLEDRNDCVLIDPGADAPRIRAALEGRRVAAILLTHGHFDHIGAAEALMEPGTELIIHTLDVPMLSDSTINAARGTNGMDITAPPPTGTIEEGSVLRYAGIEFKVLHTPGHTMGSVCYLAEGELFTGDTLFQHGWGRTDLYGGNQADMMKSLRRILPMSRTMPVHSGHYD